MPKKELAKENIVVSFVGKWGPKVGDVFYGVNDPITPAHFEKGKSYDVLVDTAASGKKYIKQIIGASDSAPQAAVPPAANQAAAETAKAYKPRDYDREARGKIASNAYNGVLASPVLGTFVETLEEYRKLVDEEVERVSKKVWEAQHGPHAGY